MAELDDSDIPAQDPDAGLNVVTATPPVPMPPRGPVLAPAPVLAPTPAAGAYPPGTPLGSSGQPLPQPPASYTLSHTAQPSPDPYGGLGNVPIAQAQTAIAAAMKFQGMRGYQQDIQSGKPAAEALARWGPMLFGSGVAGQVLRTQPTPTQWHNPAGSMPGYFSTGNRINVPRGIQSGSSGPLVKEEIVPGVWAVREPGKGLHIVKEGGGELTAAQRASLSARIPAMLASAQRFDATSPEYAASTNAVNAVRQAAEGAGAKRAPVKAPTGGNPYKVGKRYGNLRYKGGDPNDESSWEKVG